jgi:hypothetical protein
LRYIPSHDWYGPVAFCLKTPLLPMNDPDTIPSVLNYMDDRRVPPRPQAGATRPRRWLWLLLALAAVALLAVVLVRKTAAREHLAVADSLSLSGAAWRS